MCIWDGSPSGGKGSLQCGAASRGAGAGSCDIETMPQVSAVHNRCGRAHRPLHRDGTYNPGEVIGHVILRVSDTNEGRGRREQGR